MSRALPALALALIAGASGCLVEPIGHVIVKVSTAPGSIGDFAHLNVTLEAIRILSGGLEETNGGGAGRTTRTFAIDESRSQVDLVPLVNASRTILDHSLSPGSYDSLGIRVVRAEGILTDGEHREVAVENASLEFARPFKTLSGGSTLFRAVILVARTAEGAYELRPDSAATIVDEPSPTPNPGGY